MKVIVKGHKINLGRQHGPAARKNMSDAKKKLKDIPCKVCGKIFHPSWKAIKHCSIKCASTWKPGRVAWNQGKKYKIGPRPGVMPKADKHWSFKGDQVGYRGLHKWVELVLGKPKTCESCGKKGTGHDMHWANISGEYLRITEDWVRLCPKCHGEFDSNRIIG